MPNSHERCFQRSQCVGFTGLLPSGQRPASPTHTQLSLPLLLCAVTCSAWRSQPRCALGGEVAAPAAEVEGAERCCGVVGESCVCAKRVSGRSCVQGGDAACACRGTPPPPTEELLGDGVGAPSTPRQPSQCNRGASHLSHVSSCSRSGYGQSGWCSEGVRRIRSGCAGRTVFPHHE